MAFVNTAPHNSIGSGDRKRLRGPDAEASQQPHGGLQIVAPYRSVPASNISESGNANRGMAASYVQSLYVDFDMRGTAWHSRELDSLLHASLLGIA